MDKREAFILGALGANCLYGGLGCTDSFDQAKVSCLPCFYIPVRQRDPIGEGGTRAVIFELSIGGSTITNSFNSSTGIKALVSEFMDILTTQSISFQTRCRRKHPDYDGRAAIARQFQ